MVVVKSKFLFDHNRSPWLFGAVLVFGLVTFFSSVLHPLAQLALSQWWAAVPCTILSSGLKWQDTGGKRHTTAVAYSYEVGGKTYQGDRQQFGPAEWYKHGSREREAAVTARYPVGAGATCYVNPRNPADSVLERSVSASLSLPGAMGLLCAGVGGYGLLRRRRGAAGPGKRKAK